MPRTAGPLLLFLPATFGANTYQDLYTGTATCSGTPSSRLTYPSDGHCVANIPYAGGSSRAWCSGAPTINNAGAPEGFTLGVFWSSTTACDDDSPGSNIAFGPSSTNTPADKHITDACAADGSDSYKFTCSSSTAGSPYVVTEKYYTDAACTVGETIYEWKAGGDCWNDPAGTTMSRVLFCSTTVLGGLIFSSSATCDRSAGVITHGGPYTGECVAAPTNTRSSGSSKFECRRDCTAPSQTAAAAAVSAIAASRQGTGCSPLPAAGSGGLSGGAIAGIAIGSAAAVFLIVLGVWWLRCKSKRAVTNASV